MATKIQILGTGCAKCRELAEKANAAATELGILYELEKVVELREIMAFGVMVTPALVINGTVTSAGKVPAVAAIKQMLA